MQRIWDLDALRGDFPFVDHYRQCGRLHPLTLAGLIDRGYEPTPVARHRMTWSTSTRSPAC